MTGHLITTPARTLPCPACGAPVITAISGGITVTVNPSQLTLDEEIAARLAGRETYDILITGTPRRMLLEWRDVIRIRSPRIHPVAASHQCRTVIPLTAGTEIRMPAAGESFPGKPPF